MAQTSDALVASTTTPASKAKKPRRPKKSLDTAASPSTPSALAGQAQKILTEADVIAFHLSRTSTPADSPSGSTSIIKSKPSLPSKLRVSLIPPNGHPQLTLIPLSSESSYKIPARAFSTNKPGKRSPLADSSTLPEAEDVPPSDPFSLPPQPSSTTSAPNIPEKKVRKAKTTLKTIKSPKNAKRPRGDSKSSEGQSSAIIPPLSDNDEGYDQLISSQPAQPSTSPLIRMGGVEDTPAAATPQAADQTPTAKGKGKGKRKSTVQDLPAPVAPVDGDGGAAKPEKKKRKSKAAEVEAPVLPIAPSEPSEVSKEIPKEKEKGKRKRKSKAVEEPAAVEPPAPVEALAVDKTVEKKKRKSKAVVEETASAPVEAVQPSPPAEKGEKRKRKSRAAEPSADVDEPVNGQAEVDGMDKPKKKGKRVADAELAVQGEAEPVPKEKKARKKKAEVIPAEGTTENGTVDKEAVGAVAAKPAKISKRKKGTAPSWQVGTPVASSPPGP